MVRKIEHAEEPSLVDEEVGVLDTFLGLGSDIVLDRFASKKGLDRQERGSSTEPSVVVEHGDRAIAITAIRRYSASANRWENYLLLQADFEPTGDFHFRVESAGFLSTVSRLFGAHDLEVGDVDFDKSFDLYTNDEECFNELFSDKELRDSLLFNKDCSLEIEHSGGWFSEIPEGNHRLSLQVNTGVQNVRDLEVQLNTVKLLLDKMYELDLIERNGE